MGYQPKKHFTADTQIFHDLTSSLRGFATNDEHHDHVEQEWNAHVDPRDTVIVVGDSHMSSLEEAMAFYNRLPGKKVLLKGNHDKNHPMYRNAFNMEAAYRQAFAECMESMRVKFAGIDFLVNHFPYNGDTEGRESDRYVQWRLRDLGTPIIHGHVHSADKVTYSALGTAQLHVGWDAWHRPVTIEEIVALYETSVE